MDKLQAQNKPHFFSVTITFVHRFPDARYYTESISANHSCPFLSPFSQYLWEVKSLGHEADFLFARSPES